MPFCPNCGTKVSEDAQFCHECGYQLSMRQDMQGGSRKKLAEAVAKQLRPVYCARCGSLLQVRILRQNGFDEGTGYPKYDVTMACPHAILYETSVLGKPWFAWKKPSDGHTVHKVTKVLQLNSDTADTPYKQGALSDETQDIPKPK